MPRRWLRCGAIVALIPVLILAAWVSPRRVFVCLGDGSVHTNCCCDQGRPSCCDDDAEEGAPTGPALSEACCCARAENKATGVSAELRSPRDVEARTPDAESQRLAADVAPEPAAGLALPAPLQRRATVQFRPPQFISLVVLKQSFLI